MPPPSPNSAKISGEFSLEPAFQRKIPARRTVSGEILVSGEGGEPARSFVHELEPSDSERVTEVPPSDDMLEAASLLHQADAGFETIPAPAPDEELLAHED